MKHVTGTYYVTTSPLVMDVGGNGGQGLMSVIVPAGFKFNVTVPKPLRWLISPHDKRLLRAAAFHDYALYRLKWSREMAAAPFGHELRKENFGKVRRLVMVLGVITWNWK